MSQGFLHVAEHTSGTRECNFYEPEIPKDLVPVFYNYPSLVGGVVDRISLGLADHWVGRRSIMLTVSTNQPRNT